MSSDLRAFVTESNRIEGITRILTHAELDAHEDFLGLAELSVPALERFVKVVAKKPLRRAVGMNVRVGSHIAPPGGPQIEDGLNAILDSANAGMSPYVIHHRYETLHPFLDGNGRSGRVLWLWQMINQVEDPYVLSRGFLHTFYYQALSCGLSGLPGRRP